MTYTYKKIKKYIIKKLKVKKARPPENQGFPAISDVHF
jgi:hypothetical protein